MAHDVFISYSQKDKAVADAVCATLEANHIRCWIAPRDAPAGEPWAGSLIKAIRDSRAFVLVFSDGANRSPQVLREVAEAVERAIPVIPFRIEDVQPTENMRYYIQPIHWLDALTPPLEGHLHRLAGRLEALLAAEAAPPTRPAPPAAKPEPPRPRWQSGRRELLWLVPSAALLGGALVGLVMWAVLRGGPPATPIPTTDRGWTAAVPTAPETPPAIATRDTAERPASTPAAQPTGKATLTARSSETPEPTRPPPTLTSGPSPVGTPLPVQAYLLPRSEPLDLVYDGSALWALFLDGLVRLEPVEEESRFRAAEAIDMRGNSAAWDASRGQFWVVQGSTYEMTLWIDRVDRQGQVLATYRVPDGFSGAPRYAAWDGAYLWVASSEGTLYKLEVSGDQLALVDSYASSVQVLSTDEASGLAWDGQALWLQVENQVARLDRAGRSLCRLDLGETGAPVSWFGWRGLAADGRFLWVVTEEGNSAYRVDPAMCK